jgi:nitronate monooxygenase
MAKNILCEHAHIAYPIIGGAMYPCTNPELVAAVSEAGGIGIIQPLSMVFVYKYDFLKGLKYIQSLTKKPIGMNIILEKSVKAYTERMDAWLEIALEQGVRFFVTSLGNPANVVKRIKACGGIVYHDVTEKKWADKAVDAGVDGLICVNNRAGGHAGEQGPEALFDSLKTLNIPLVCAGGVSTREDYLHALTIGYSGVQIGTRFIASNECKAHDDYKKAICDAQEEDIVLSEKISGVPVAVIRTAYIDKVGTKAGFFAKAMLKNPKLKHWMRLIYSLEAMWKLKNASQKGKSYQNYWQAGKSVSGISSILSVREIVNTWVKDAP